MAEIFTKHPLCCHTYADVGETTRKGIKTGGFDVFFKDATPLWLSKTKNQGELAINN
jgi:hypothetical protein